MMSSTTDIRHHQDVTESPDRSAVQDACSPLQHATRNKTVNRKLDVALLPLLSLLYLFNGLDRGNVGNAETQGILDLLVKTLAQVLIED